MSRGGAVGRGALRIRMSSGTAVAQGLAPPFAALGRSAPSSNQAGPEDGSWEGTHAASGTAQGGLQTGIWRACGCAAAGAGNGKPGEGFVEAGKRGTAGCISRA